MNNDKYINTDKITIIEYLYKNQGLLKRMLLIYEELIRRLENNIRIGNKIIYYSANIINNFIENYLEKTKEKYIFPLLQKNNFEIKLLNEIKDQYKLKKQLTNTILKLSENDIITDKNELIFYLQQYIKITRYHMSREDTVVIPKFISLLDNESKLDYSCLFDEQQSKNLGADGFNKYLNIIVSIEKYIKIHDLSIVRKEINDKIYYK